MQTTDSESGATYYRFLPAKYAVRAIEEMELRLGRLKELNDPFEFCPAYSEARLAADPELWTKNGDDKDLDWCNDTFGILCFSAALDDPVVWSHYSDGHRGIVLGFQFEPDQKPFAVEYPKDNRRPAFDVESYLKKEEADHDAEFPPAYLKTKAPSWAYEREYRQLLKLNQCRTHDGMYFKKYPRASLKHVISGCRCPVSDQYLEHALRASGSSAVVKTARLDPVKFRVHLYPSMAMNVP